MGTEDPSAGMGGSKPSLPSSREEQGNPAHPTPPSSPPNPQTFSTQPKHENLQFGEESAPNMSVGSRRALSPQGDDKIFFAIKILLKLGPRKMQRRKLFKRREILFCSNYHVCISTKAVCLLPPPDGRRELPLPGLYICLHAGAQCLPRAPSPRLISASLPTLSSGSPHQFQSSDQKSFFCNLEAQLLSPALGLILAVCAPTPAHRGIFFLLITPSTGQGSWTTAPCWCLSLRL